VPGYKVRVTDLVTNSVDESDATFAIVAPAGQPNLVVTQIEWGVPTPCVNQLLQVRAKVRNGGPGSAVASQLQLKRGTPRDTVNTPALAAGQEAWTDWGNVGLPGPGTHTVWACADILAQVPESNETDNCLSRLLTPVSCKAGDGLIATALELDSADQPRQVRVKVRNGLDVEMAGGRCRIWVDGGPGSVVDVAGPLSPWAETWSSWTDLGTLAVGAHEVVACADMSVARTDANLADVCVAIGFRLLSEVTPGVQALKAGDRTAMDLPNPYRPNTQIRLVAGSGTNAVRIAVYNVHGQRVRTLYDGPSVAGEQLLRWDGRTDRGEEVGIGIYYLRAEVGRQEIRKTILLVK
jgi:hypothetical protein